MKSAVKEFDVAVEVEPVAVHIDVAAQMLGISRRAFYDYFIKARRVLPVYVGSRAMVDIAELRAAWHTFASDPQNKVRIANPPNPSSV